MKEETKMKYTIDVKVELPNMEEKWAEKLVNNIIWGNSQFNPNNKENDNKHNRNKSTGEERA